MAALIGLLLCVLAAETWLRAAREEALFEADLRRDQLVLGRALRATFEQVHRERGAVDARALLEAARGAEEEIELRLVSLDPDAPAELRPTASLGALALLAGGEVVHLARVHDLGRLYTYIPLDIARDDPPRGGLALELSRSLTEPRVHAEQGLARLLTLTGMMTLLAAAVVVFFGDRLVGRAIRALTSQARRVGKGEFIHHAPVRQRDELGQLAVELDAMADNLREATRQRDAELEARARAEVQLRRADRLATVGTLAAGLAHELATPLHVIAARARMLADVERSRPRSAEAIVAQCERMNRVVRQLLDFARPPAGAREEIDLAALLRAAIDQVTAAAPATVRVELVAPAPRCQLHGDPEQLERVFTNLLVNAVQAMPDGGVVRVGGALLADEEPRGASSCARVWILDEGVGIAPDELPRIFEPFFTTKAVGEGTGLGLAIAQRIVVEHGGSITARSEQGAGTRFEVLLPVQAIT
ncbi:MAG: HAMP domain-containing protein [Myxococcales bacterium]|nr:HAMP domain-containing protein [Myxococcales bacterium]